MMTRVRTDEGAQASEEMAATLDDLAREGGRRMIVAALEIEVEAYLARHRSARTERGHAMVVRNGQARPRRVTMGAGTVRIQAPRWEFEFAATIDSGLFATPNGHGIERRFGSIALHFPYGVFETWNDVLGGTDSGPTYGFRLMLDVPQLTRLFAG